MRHSRWILALCATLLALVSASMLGSSSAEGVTTARGDICPAFPGHPAGVIPTTLTIVDNTRLTCDVQCLQLDNGPCVSFGRSNIKFDLNRFKMTGPANEPPRSSCVTATEFPTHEADGIQSKFDEVVIEGPGLVQRMRRHGIALLGGTPDAVEKVVVKKLVSHENCFSGIFMGLVNNTLIEEVVSARNSANSEFRPCGGICVTNSSDNRVRRSEFSGTGSIAPGPPPAAIPNDFGVGLVGASNRNVVEENGIGGNINGLALFPLGAAVPMRNLIRKNVIVGNPPIEVSADNPLINPVGSDIRDFAGSAANNRFEDNLCITYTVDPNLPAVSPPPCAGRQHESARMFEQKLPQYAGHQNN
jgi:Right handed beta helix region